MQYTPFYRVQKVHDLNSKLLEVTAEKNKAVRDKSKDKESMRSDRIKELEEMLMDSEMSAVDALETVALRENELKELKLERERAKRQVDDGVAREGALTQRLREETRKCEKLQAMLVRHFCHGYFFVCSIFFCHNFQGEGFMF
jgi:hypothetical protein